MGQYSDLLEKAIKTIASQFARKSTGNLFAGRGVKTDEFIKMPGSAGICVLGDADELKNELSRY